MTIKKLIISSLLAVTLLSLTNIVSAANKTLPLSIDNQSTYIGTLIFTFNGEKKLHQIPFSKGQTKAYISADETYIRNGLDDNTVLAKIGSFTDNCTVISSISKGQLINTLDATINSSNECTVNVK